MRARQLATWSATSSTLPAAHATILSAGSNSSTGLRGMRRRCGWAAPRPESSREGRVAPHCRPTGGQPARNHWAVSRRGHAIKENSNETSMDRRSAGGRHPAGRLRRPRNRTVRRGATGQDHGRWPQAGSVGASYSGEIVAALREPAGLSHVRQDRRAPGRGRQRRQARPAAACGWTRRRKRCMWPPPAPTSTPRGAASRRPGSTCSAPSNCWRASSPRAPNSTSTSLRWTRPKSQLRSALAQRDALRQPARLHRAHGRPRWRRHARSGRGRTGRPRRTDGGHRGRRRRARSGDQHSGVARRRTAQGASSCRCRSGRIRASSWAGILRELAPGTDSVTRTYSARISIRDAGPGPAASGHDGVRVCARRRRHQRDPPAADGHRRPRRRAPGLGGRPEDLARGRCAT